MKSGSENPRYRLTAATAADEDWLERLRRRAYADLFDATWGGWDEARHARHFAESFESGHISIIEVDGDRVGMVQRFEDADGVELREIQIDPTHQGRGIGTWVLRDVISGAGARGRDVRLTVGLKNREAIRLYERLGFRSVGESETHRHMRLDATR
jgi:ribosomal protein S18 acetylase RimI-like enzyme